MKILVIKTSSLGDIIHTFPAITDAKRAIPSLRIDWVVEEAFKEIPLWHKEVERVIPVAWRRWRKKKHWKDLKREFPSFKTALTEVIYDKVIDAQGLLKSGIITRLAKGERIGLDRKSLTEPLARIFYQKTLSVNLKKPAIFRMRSIFAKALGYNFENLTLDFGLKTMPDPKLKKPYLFFAHGTTWSSRKWPFKHWLALAKKIAVQGFYLYIPWKDSEEKAFAKKISDAVPTAMILPETTLSTLAAIIAYAKAIVSVDSGLGHLAIALNRPSIMLYGPTEPKSRMTTTNQKQSYLQADFDCLNCYRSVCHYHSRKHDTPQCLIACKPDEVWHKLSSILK